MNSENFLLRQIQGEIRGTSFFSIKCDFLAGLQVALLTLPQAMAYALIAGLPLSAGLFAAIFSAAIAVFFSSSRYLIAGPINSIAIMIQTSVADILYTSFRDLPDSERQMMAFMIMMQLAFIVGLFQTIAAVFKLGRLTQFVSQPVVRGYMAGSMLAVIFGQMISFTGMPESFGASSLFEKGHRLLTRFDLIDMPTFLTGSFSLMSLILLKRIDKRLPAGLITIVLATSIVYFFNETIISDHLSSVVLIGETAERGSLLPKFTFPHFDFKLINQLFPISFAIALLGIVETTCTAKSMAAKTGQNISINQEILSIGLGNLFSAFTGAMPIAVSPVRSALNFASGAQTRLAGLFNVTLVAAMVSIFAFFVNLIPLATLSALILVTAIHLVNVKQTIVCLKATPQDRYVLLTTFLACLFFSLDVAFYIGVILSITSYLMKAAIPQVVEYAVHDSGELRAIRPVHQMESKPIRVIKVEGELFFGAAEVFENSLKAIAKDDRATKVIILQLKNARDIDATACLTLIDLSDSLKAAGCHLLIAGVTLSLWEVLSISSVVERIGKENLFLFEETTPHLYMQKAFERAKVLVALAEVNQRTGSSLVSSPLPSSALM